ncbi:MAG: M42 family peptidase [Deltaproteobacteria bacterium]|nr:MAG: M42 family peptidase [Deltaproteobacteria bacterium]
MAKNDSRQFLERLLATPSPSGYEQPAQRLVRERLEEVADEIRSDVHGNLIAVLNPGGSPRVMLAGHVDQIGFMVRHVSEQGYLHFAPIGGIDAAVVPGLELTVHTAGGPLPAVVGRKPIHLMKPEERNRQKIEIDRLWLDIGARDGKQARRLVQVGDVVTYRLAPQRLLGNNLAAAGMDDKAGVCAVTEALRLLGRQRRRLRCAVYAVSTVQEELGLRGARTSSFGIDPQLGIAVDVTHAADHPGGDKKRTGDIRLGRGPAVTLGPNINPVLSKLLLDTARLRKIAVQREAEPRATGTDANVMQVTRAGVAAGLLGIPCRYMHTPVEVVNTRDIDLCARLLAETCLRVGPRSDFIPR